MTLTKRAYIGLGIAAAMVVFWALFAIIRLMPVVGFHPTPATFN